MSNLVKKTLDNIKQRRYNALHNISNCIPCPLPRLAKEWAGLERRKYIIVAGSDKSSKTQFSSFLFVYNSLHYAMKHSNTKVDVLYFNLEEDKEDVLNRYILYLLKIKHGVLSNNDELLSTGTILPETICNTIESSPFNEYLEYFDQHVTFSNINTVPEMLNKMIEWNNQFGTYDENDKFKLNFDNHYRIILTDHIGLIDAMQGETLFNTLKTFSHKCIHMRDAYNLTICNIQQCSANSEGLEAIKMSRLLPSKYTLAEYRNSIADVNTMFGIFNPSKVNLDTFNGYLIYDNINKEDVLGDNARFVNIMANRGGRLGAILSLYTDGSNAYFEELPSLREKKKLEEFYEKLRNKRNLEMMKTEEKEQSLITSQNSNQPIKVIKSFFANIVSVKKAKKKYELYWDLESLPDKLHIGYNYLIPILSDKENVCDKCWFHNECNRSDIPCAPRVYWTLEEPQPQNNTQETNKIEIKNQEEEKDKTIGFKFKNIFKKDKK